MPRAISGALLGSKLQDRNPLDYFGVELPDCKASCALLTEGPCVRSEGSTGVEFSAFWNVSAPGQALTFEVP